MSLPYLLGLASAVIVLSAAISAFKDYRFDASEWLLPAMGGSILVATSFLPRLSANTWSFPMAIALTLFWLRSRRVEADWSEGLLSAAVLSVSTVVISAIIDPDAPQPLAVVIVAASLAALLLYARPLRLRRSRFLAAVISAGLLYLLLPILQSRMPDTAARNATFLLAALLLLALLASIARWPSVRRELAEEAGLGVLPEEEVRGVANPFRRLAMNGWVDLKARREFVRLATALALQKARQRDMDAARARLNQLEVLRIRRLLQDVWSVEMSMRNTPAWRGEEQQQQQSTSHGSDTLG